MTPEARYSSEAHRRIEGATYIDSAMEGGVRIPFPPIPVTASVPKPIHDFVARAERHAYKWEEVGRPLPLC